MQQLFSKNNVGNYQDGAHQFLREVLYMRVNMQHRGVVLY